MTIYKETVHDTLIDNNKTNTNYNFDNIKRINIPNYNSDCEKLKNSDIYHMTVSIIKENKNIEEFIAAKDAHYMKLKQREIENNSSVIYSKEIINSTKQAYDKDIEEKNKLDNHLSKLENLFEQVEKLKNSFPVEKQSELKSFLSQAINGYSTTKLNNLTKPSSFLSKIKNYYKMKKATQKLNEFIKNNNLKELNLSLSDNKIAQSDLYAVLSFTPPSLCMEQINKIEQKIPEKLAIIQKQQQILTTTVDNELQKLRFQLDAENEVIQNFVTQKKEIFIKAANVSKEDIETNGLTKEYIEAQILLSKNPQKVSKSICDFYEKLNKPAAPILGYSSSYTPVQIASHLKEAGLDAVTEDDPRSSNPNVFVVTKTGIHSPFLSPEEALKANIKIIEAIPQSTVSLSHPLTREEIAPAAKDIGKNLDINIISRANGSNYQEIIQEYSSLENYVDMMMKDVIESGIPPTEMNKENIETLQNKGELSSVFHGGFSGDPYAVLVKEETYGHTYGAAFGGKGGDISISGYNQQIVQGACDYVTPQGSANNSKFLSCLDKKIVYGFVFEYESKGKQQGFGDINHSYLDSNFNKEKVHDKNETAIFAHQNKLKRVWISAYDKEKQQQKVIPLELNENGEIADKKWREFVNLHKPIDTCLSERMTERRNNMLKQYDDNGTISMMRTISDLSNNDIYTPAEKIDLDKIYENVYGHSIQNEQQNTNLSMPSPLPTQDTSLNMPSPLPTQDTSLNMPPPLPTQSASLNMPPPLPTQGTSLNMPPPLPTQGASLNMPPPLPTQGASLNMPPPLPTQGASLNMPPPLPTQGASLNMPPPLPTQGASLNMPPANIQDMSNNQRGHFINSLRHGTNILLTPTTQIQGRKLTAQNSNLSEMIVKKQIAER